MHPVTLILVHVHFLFTFCDLEKVAAEDTWHPKDRISLPGRGGGHPKNRISLPGGGGGGGVGVWFPANSNVTCTGKGVKIDSTNQ